MSKASDTYFYESEQRRQERRNAGTLKTAGAWIGIAVGVLTLCGGMAKAYFQHPMKLDQHDKAIDKLERQMGEQRDILLEMRTDLKYIKNNTP